MNVCPTPRTIEVRDETYPAPCGSRYCAVCGQRWQGDMRAQAVAATEHLPGGLALVTITAPGNAYFGSLDAWGMTPMPIRYERWNRSARRRWRALHLHAAAPLRRWAEKIGLDWRILFRAWEYQKRGALHVHVVVPYGTPDERRFTDAWVHNLWACAAEFGFGYVLGGDKKQQPAPGQEPKVVPADGPAAARYVCKYVSSTGAGKGSMVEVAQRTAQRGSVLYVSRTLTQASGLSMTTLRARRRIVARHPWAVESNAAWDEACMVDAVQRGRAPLTEDAITWIREAVRRTGATLWAGSNGGQLYPPTPAPPPRQMARTSHVNARPRSVLLLELASVLLGDPERPNLGGRRTEVFG